MVGRGKQDSAYDVPVVLGLQRFFSISRFSHAERYLHTGGRKPVC